MPLIGYNALHFDYVRPAFDVTLTTLLFKVSRLGTHTITGVTVALEVYSANHAAQHARLRNQTVDKVLQRR